MPTRAKAEAARGEAAEAGPAGAGPRSVSRFGGVLGARVFSVHNAPLMTNFGTQKPEATAAPATDGAQEPCG